MRELHGPHNNHWNPYSLWVRRLRVIQEAKELLRYKIAARLDRVRNQKQAVGRA